MKPYPIELRIRVLVYYYSNYYEPRFSINKMLSIFCISRSTFYEWRKLHLNNKINDINLRSKYISTKINYDIKQYIIKYVLKKAFINTILIKNNIRRKFGINISTSSIYLLLKTNKIKKPKRNFVHIR